MKWQIRNLTICMYFLGLCNLLVLCLWVLLGTYSGDLSTGLQTIFTKHAERVVTYRENTSNGIEDMGISNEDN